MIEKILPKYNLFLAIGILIITSGLLLGAYRYNNEKTLSAERLSGNTNSDTFGNALATEMILSRTIEQWLFVGLAFLKVGIGFAIAMIVINLRETGAKSREALKSIDEKVPVIKPPFIARIFPKLLIIGFIIIVLAFFPFTIWWDLNAVKIVDLQTSGLTSSQAYQSALELDKILDHLIKPGKMIGTGLLILGIAFGLATIVMNLVIQTEVMPNKMLRIIDRAQGKKEEEDNVPVLKPPIKLLILPVLGFLMVLSGTFPLAIIRSQKEITALRGIEGVQVLLNARTTANVLEHFIEPWIFLGLTLMLIGIGSLLLQIVWTLRNQRGRFSDLMGRMTDRELPQLDPPIWTVTAVKVLMVIGLIIVLFTLYPLMATQISNERTAQKLIFTGAGESVRHFNAARSVRLLEEFIKPFKFVGVSTVMLGIGLSLVTIVINLKLTGLLLPGVFSRFLAACRREKPEDFNPQDIPNPGSVAPWNLFIPLLIGVLLVYTATMPLTYWRVQSTQAFLAEELAGNRGSQLWQENVLNERLLEHVILPWKIFGIGLIFYAIGKFFAAIVGYVSARRLIVTDGIKAGVQIVKDMEGN